MKSPFTCVMHPRSSFDLLSFVLLLVSAVLELPVVSGGCVCEALFPAWLELLAAACPPLLCAELLDWSLLCATNHPADSSNMNPVSKILFISCSPVLAVLASLEVPPTIDGVYLLWVALDIQSSGPGLLFNGDGV